MKKISRLILLFSLIFILGCANSGIAFAAEEAPAITYTGVLEDLQKDESFDVSAYPAKADDYSLQVIQIAESVNDELFVYVYQPSGKDADLRATSINISIGNNVLKYINYKLQFMNSHETLFKYKVVGFTVPDIRIRYYDITSIYRAWNKDYGDDKVDDQPISEVPFSVSKVYAFGVKNGNVVCECVDVETIPVTSKYVGFVRYYGGVSLPWVGVFENDCDSHFVAFSTDKKIDNLLEADVYFVWQSAERWTDRTGGGKRFGETEEQYRYLTYLQEGYFDGDGWFGCGKHEFKRVQTVNDFLKGENFENVYEKGTFHSTTTTKITEAAKKEIAKQQWVLRFVETEYKDTGSGGWADRHWTIVGDVSILRLKFETDGQLYNLGVIDNKQSGSQTPSSDTEVKDDIGKKLDDLMAMFQDFWKKLTAFWNKICAFFADYGWIIAIVVAFIALAVVCALVKPVWTVVKKILTVLWYIVTAPIQLIVFIARKVKERKNE